MKTKLHQSWVSVFILTALYGCGGGGGGAPAPEVAPMVTATTTPTPVSPTVPTTPTTPAQSGFAGTYSCTFNGTDSGTISLVMNTPSGAFSSCVGSSRTAGQFLCSGQVTSTGSLFAAFGSTGATANGQLTATGGSGTWTNFGGAGGSISCSRS